MDYKQIKDYKRTFGLDRWLCCDACCPGDEPGGDCCCDDDDLCEGEGDGCDGLCFPGDGWGWGLVGPGEGFGVNLWAGDGDGTGLTCWCGDGWGVGRCCCGEDPGGWPGGWGCWCIEPWLLYCDWELGAWLKPCWLYPCCWPCNYIKHLIKSQNTNFKFFSVKTPQID